MASFIAEIAPMCRRFAWASALAGFLFVAGCNQSPSAKSSEKSVAPAKSAENHRIPSSESAAEKNEKTDASDHDDDHDHDHEHVHKAAHGGLLVPLGEHFANIELVQDQSEKTLTAYTYDSCAENLTRVKQEKIEVKVVTSDGEIMLSLQASDNPLTGEKPGDASAFQAKHDKLASPIKSGEIVKINIRGSDFANVAFAKK